MEETTINNNNMEEKLILNSIEDAEIISVRLSPDETPINKRKSSIFKEPDGSIHDVDAFSKVPVKKFLFATRTWTENIHKIGRIGGLFETDENGILTGRYFGRCNVKDYQNGYMPKGKKEIPCREIEISPDNWIMTVESNNEALIELSKIYDIVWRQCPCLKGIMNTNVTPELERLACEQMKG